MARRHVRHSGLVSPPQPPVEPGGRRPVEGPSNADRPAFKNPGRVHGSRPASGLAALRARLNLSDRAPVDEVADTALALIAELESGPKPMFPPDPIAKPREPVTL